jgi:hypothetical protein
VRTSADGWPSSTTVVVPAIRFSAPAPPDALGATASADARVSAVPFPPPPPSGSSPLLTRRGLLATAAGTLVAASGCTSTGGSGPGGVRRPAEEATDPDVAVAADALADRRAALDVLAGTTARHPRLTDLLAATVLVLEDHVGLLTDAVPGSAGSPTPATGAPPTTTHPTTDPTAGPERANGTGRAAVRVPRDRGRALAAAAAELRSLATATKRHAFAAESGAFARLLGSMAAAATQQAVRLEQSSRGRGGPAR